MTDKQINFVKKLDKTVFFDGDTIQFNFIEFDKPIKGVCFNKSVYIPIEETEYILQQLLDKEQECEELKKECAWVKESCTLNEGINYDIWYSQKLELDQLKAENEELKGIRDRNFLHALEEQKRAEKYFKTLTEIKEIAEPYYTLGSKDSPVAQILQKISECEVDNEV